MFGFAVANRIWKCQLRVGERLKIIRKKLKRPTIRIFGFFTVEKAMSFAPEPDLKGGEWQVCSSQTLGSFSATAYFFGRQLYQELGVPIGLINASWGGTNIQTWMSEDAIRKIDIYKDINQQQNQKTATAWEINRRKYQEAMEQDPGALEKMVFSRI